MIKQAGAELCQAQDKLEVIVYIGVKVEFKMNKVKNMKIMKIMKI